MQTERGVRWETSAKSVGPGGRAMQVEPHLAETSRSVRMRWKAR